MTGLSSSSNAERAAAVLLVLGEAGSDGLALKDIAARMGEAKPAVHRTLVALAKHGFVEQARNRGGYRLGPSIYALACRQNTAAEKVRKWRPALMALAERLGHGVYLMERAGMDAVVLDMHMGTAPIQALTNGVGGRLPMGLGPGSASILAMQDGGTRDFILTANADRFAQRAIGQDIVRRMVERAAEQGFGIDLGEIIPGCGGIAIPIRERGGGTTTAISTAMPLSFLSQPNIDLVLREIRAVIAAG
ncbi:IclR family transcriptional regulator [Skermanella stibiiresistens SB22]|jgi:DNA-binding IclR family transcriptional regulator|uniref:IclR family transcriptional regulator n=1 Tax=Skermanella stibiiresistens SB22 TaxID=1385369 RepID=W9H8H6_9PROT|nr:helix-turn-helix domain-containing protein [Skermanella stibiiresistens]EWY40987.1 IclR family transcriptional regulator [Skermanella stibiiresistens SB22]